MDRHPIVAGQFYLGTRGALERAVRDFLAGAGPRAVAPTLLAMAPHAGYAYSGAVAGLTLGRADLADTLVLLGPNHTGRGKPLAIWPQGNWLTPLGPVAVDEPLAQALLDAGAGFQADPTAHLGEHSLEVLLPFLTLARPGCSVVPVAVAEPRLAGLAAAARALAGVVAGLGRPVSLVVSSDMSHYVPAETAKRLDASALEAVTRLDGPGLYEVVRRQGISMCGVLPMALGLMAAVELGATRAEVAAYATSGDVSGDFDQVVGYAGVLVS